MRYIHMKGVLCDSIGQLWMAGGCGICLASCFVRQPSARMAWRHRDAAGGIVGGEDGAENTAAHARGGRALLGKG